MDCTEIAQGTETNVQIQILQLLVLIPSQEYSEKLVFSAHPELMPCLWHTSYCISSVALGDFRM